MLMKPEHIVQVLYDLSLLIGGETQSHSLITKFLQRILYHTSIPCGMYIQCLKTKKNNTSASYQLLEVVGCKLSTFNRDKLLVLPHESIVKKKGLQNNTLLIDHIFNREVKYKSIVILPITKTEYILLLRTSESALDFPLELIFEPILNTFNSKLILCRKIEHDFLTLEKEINKRKELEGSLRDSHRLLQNVIDTVPSSIFWKDTNSVYLGCNDLFAQYSKTGSVNDVVGKMDKDFPWKKNYIAYLEEDQKIMLSREAIINLEISYKSQGETVYLELSKIPLININNEVVGILGSFIDITERKKVEIALKESEVRHRSIFEATVDSIINTDEFGIITSLNPATEKLFGYALEELLNKNISMLMSKSIAKKHDGYFSSLKKTVHGTVLGTSRDLLALKKDGSVFPIEIALDEMFINKKRMFTGIIKDISLRRKFEDEIITAKESAENANLAKSQFLSNMSHELRTPLNAILGFGQLLQMDFKNDKAHLLNINEIIDAGSYLLKLIDEILDLAKIESGKMDVFIEGFYLDEVITQSIDLVSPLESLKSITIINKLPKNTYMVLADKVRLKQVLINLLSNAIKFNINNGQVTLSYDVIDETYLRVSIVDNGCGISVLDIQQLFTPFKRLNQDNNIEGTGIGLSICKELIELMSGRIGAESEVGKGSTFWFELPLTKAESL